MSLHDSKETGQINMIHFKLTLKILDYTKETLPIKTNVILLSLIFFLLDSISEILYSPVFSTSGYLLEFLIFNHCEMIQFLSFLDSLI